MFICTKCDAQAAKWEGRCSVCDSWGTLMEETAIPPLHPSTSLRAGKGGLRGVAVAGAAKSARLFDIAGADKVARISTGEGEVDRVLGGGVVPGSLILLSGEPGIGKSTLIASIAAGFKSVAPSPPSPPSGRGGNAKILPLPKGELEGVAEVLYVSGEESAPQLSSRFARLGGNAQHIRVLDLFPVETLVATIEKEKPGCVIVDSVQTLSSAQLDSASGTPAMIRYATSLFLELAKRTHIPIFLIGQVTKDGSIAGPKTLEHLVDVVLSLEGDPVHAYRILRATKNRFGATGEVGVFEMTGAGLKAVENPSATFLAERTNTPGSVITATLEGSRVFLVEVQALVEKTSFGMPVRRASGFDQNRLQMLCAILSRRGGLKLGDQDVYVNVIGGLTLTEPAADLAVCAAIVGAFKNVSSPTALYIGEVGLAGEVRSVPFLEQRLKEAQRLGITNAVTPQTLKHVSQL